ncbi:MAG: thioester reductase domain-containing protein [Planctomycetota bacterium]|jgi:thioester reductase-like protein
MNRSSLWCSREFLHSEAELPSWPTPVGAPPTAESWRVALLTGATGFVGANLVARLLEEPPTRLERIHLLVRAEDAEHGRTRVREGLSRYGLAGADDDRIRVVVGDLSRPRFGLDESAWQRMADEVDCIFHLGAAGEWFAPYSRVAATDVGSTREVVGLATTGRTKIVHYTGSLASWASMAVPEGSVIYEDRHLEECETLPGGYCQGKWVCEAMLRAAVSRGLPVVVHRLGDVKGDSRTGLGNLRDFGYRLLRGCAIHGLAPEMAYRPQYIPIDFAVETIAALARDPRAIGRTFQQAAPQPTAWSDVLERMRAAGHDVRVVSLEEFWGHLAKRDAAPALRDLRPVFRPFRDREGRRGIRFMDVGVRLYSHVFDTRETEEALGPGPTVAGSAFTLMDRYIAAAVRETAATL